MSKQSALKRSHRMLRKKGYVSHQSGKWWEGSFLQGGFDEGMTRGFPGKHADCLPGGQRLDPKR